MVAAPVPLVVCAPWLSRARALRPHLFFSTDQVALGRAFTAVHLEWTRDALPELLTLATATKSETRELLHHYQTQWELRLREFMSRRWPRPRHRSDGAQYYGRLTNHENSLCGQSAARTREQGLAGIVWALQAWHDHVVRTLLAAMHREFTQVRSVSPRGAHAIDALELNVADAQRAIETRLVYAGPCEIAWPNPPLSLTE